MGAKEWADYDPTKKTRWEGASEAVQRRVILRETKGQDLREVAAHAHEIAKLTRGASGAYRIPFRELLPLLDKMVEEET